MENETLLKHIIENRLKAAWFCLIGRPVMFKVSVKKGHITVCGENTIISFCKFYGGGWRFCRGR